MSSSCRDLSQPSAARYQRPFIIPFDISSSLHQPACGGATSSRHYRPPVIPPQLQWKNSIQRLNMLSPPRDKFSSRSLQSLNSPPPSKKVFHAKLGQNITMNWQSPSPLSYQKALRKLAVICDMKSDFKQPNFITNGSATNLDKSTLLVGSGSTKSIMYNHQSSQGPKPFIPSTRTQVFTEKSLETLPRIQTEISQISGGGGETTPSKQQLAMSQSSNSIFFQLLAHKPFAVKKQVHKEVYKVIAPISSLYSRSREVNSTRSDAESPMKGGRTAVTKTASANAIDSVQSAYPMYYHKNRKEAIERTTGELTAQNVFQDIASSKKHDIWKAVQASRIARKEARAQEEEELQLQQEYVETMEKAQKGRGIRVIN